MTEQSVLLDIDQGIAKVTLNRPESLNSFNVEMHKQMRAVLKTIRNDASVRVMLLTGNGRGFCAGQDLSDRTVKPGAQPPDLGASIEQYYNPLLQALRDLPMPVICAVNGVAAGAGANIALSCDITLAARSANFVQAFCKIGLVPDCGGTWTLPRAVGMARAKGLTLLGDKLSAEKAEQWGMIWQCVDDDALHDGEAQACAGSLGGKIGLEDSVALVEGDAWPVVEHGHQHPLLLGAQHHTHLATARSMPRERRVAGVLDEVDQHLRQQLAVRPHIGDSALDPQHWRYIVMGVQRGDLLGDAHEIDVIEARPRHARELTELAHDALHALDLFKDGQRGLLEDLVEVGVTLRVGLAHGLDGDLNR